MEDVDIPRRSARRIVKETIGPIGPIGFAKECIWFIKKCRKPTAAEYSRDTTRVVLAFAVMGFTAFYVKILFILVKNIIFDLPLLGG